MKGVKWLGLARLVLGMLLILASRNPAGAQQAPVTTGGVTGFSEGFTGHPGGIVLGPDGNFWFTEQFDDRIGVFDLGTKTAREIALPPGTFPHNIIVGPDQNIWFSGNNDRIGRYEIDTGALTIYSEGITPGTEPHFLVPDPTDDRYFWFTGQHGDRLGRLDRATGQSVMFAFPEGAGPHGMIVGAARDSLVICLQGSDQLVELDLSSPGQIASQAEFEGSLTLLTAFPAGSGPHDPLFGPDGKLYVTLQGSSRLARFDPATSALVEFDPGLSSLTRGAELYTLIVGPDNASIWFNQFLTGRVGRLDLATGAFTHYKVGLTPFGGPLELVLGPDGNVWFTEVSLNPTRPGRIVRLEPGEADRFTDPARGLVATLFYDFLQAAPAGADLAYLVPMLNDGAANPFQIALSLQESREARAGLVSFLYFRHLRRPADPGGLDYFTRRLRRGDRVGEVEAVLLGSPEYFRNRGGGTPAGFLNALFLDLLGRTPDPGDTITYNAALVPKAARLARVPEPEVSAPRSAKGLSVKLARVPGRYPVEFSSAAAAGVRRTRFRAQTSTIGQLRSAVARGIPPHVIAAAVVFSEERSLRQAEEAYGRLMYGPIGLADRTLFANAVFRGVEPSVVAAAIAGSDDYLQRRVIGRAELPPGGIPD